MPDKTTFCAFCALERFTRVFLMPTRSASLPENESGHQRRHTEGGLPPAAQEQREWITRTDALIRDAETRLADCRTARRAYERKLSLLLQAPGSAPSYWLKMGRIDASAWQAGSVRLPLGPVRVGDCYFVYANGAGAVGMLEVTPKGAQWRLRTPTLADAVPPARLKQALGLSHPSRTVAPIAVAKANALFELLVTGLTGTVHSPAGSQSV